jgi:hypothetical protein
MVYCPFPITLEAVNAQGKDAVHHPRTAMRTSTCPVLGERCATLLHLIYIFDEQHPFVNPPRTLHTPSLSPALRPSHSDYHLPCHHTTTHSTLVTRT